jgi:hypothetical protein
MLIVFFTVTQGEIVIRSPTLKDVDDPEVNLCGLE